MEQLTNRVLHSPSPRFLEIIFAFFSKFFIKKLSKRGFVFSQFVIELRWQHWVCFVFLTPVLVPSLKVLVHWWYQVQLVQFPCKPQTATNLLPISAINCLNNQPSTRLQSTTQILLKLFYCQIQEGTEALFFNPSHYVSVLYVGLRCPSGDIIAHWLIWWICLERGLFHAAPRVGRKFSNFQLLVEACIVLYFLYFCTAGPTTLDMAWYEAAFGIFEILVIMVIEGIWVIMRFKKQ